MRSYLLGTLAADHRTAFEERILCEPEIYKELLLTEEELIDQCLAGDLSQTERNQFEAHFLITAERQKNFRFGKLLKQYLNSQPPLSSENISAAPPVEKPAPAQSSQLPAEIVSPGDYQGRLSGVLDSGQDEFIDNYSFGVSE